MRILLVIDHCPPFIGGAHRQAQILARELRRRGHLVHVAAPWQKGEPARREEDGVVVHRVRELRTALPQLVPGKGQRHAPPFPDPLLAWQLRSIIRTIEPDVIHSYGWMSFSCAAALLGMRIPLLVSARDYAYFCATRTLVIEDVRETYGRAALERSRLFAAETVVPQFERVYRQLVGESV
jgi:glycosyltransferase involved in cell wall biosynthesis